MNGRDVPAGQEYAAVLKALGQFKVDLSKAQQVIAYRDPANDKRAVVIVTTDEYPGGFALVLTGELLMAMADSIRDADRRNGGLSGT